MTDEQKIGDKFINIGPNLYLEIEELEPIEQKVRKEASRIYQYQREVLK